MMDDDERVTRFEAALRAAWEAWRSEAHYTWRRYKPMVRRYGAVGTVKRQEGGYPSECSAGSIGVCQLLGVGVNIRARTRRCGRGSRTIERASTTSTGCVGQPDSSARIAASRVRGCCPTGVARAPAVAGAYR